jgi:hypothetical protein
VAAKDNGKRLASIVVEGFKSLKNETKLELRPLTLLAGANGSGKSSIMQPLLLLKQTLEASYDPGPLLLNGPNVRFTAFDQLLWRPANEGKIARHFEFQVKGDDEDICSWFSKGRRGIEIKKQRSSFRLVPSMVDPKGSVLKLELRPNTSRDDLAKQGFGVDEAFFHGSAPGSGIQRNRCFLHMGSLVGERRVFFGLPVLQSIPEGIQNVIHLPGLRGNPARSYNVASAGPGFPGIFTEYVAGIVAFWKNEKDTRLDDLGNNLQRLGLSWKVDVSPIDETQVELKVGRLVSPYKNHGTDMVNIADAGFGLSQTLPVVVALLQARKGQIVYLEQPEIHLHPRAQLAMAELIADAAKRGVIVVAETHSQFLLWGIQRLIAQDKLDPNLVNLNWFERGPDGVTKVTAKDLDSTGDLGDWPEDFGQISLEVQDDFLKAFSKKAQSSR